MGFNNQGSNQINYNQPMGNMGNNQMNYNQPMGNNQMGNQISSGPNYPLNNNSDQNKFIDFRKFCDIMKYFTSKSPFDLKCECN